MFSEEIFKVVDEIKVKVGEKDSVTLTKPEEGEELSDEVIFELASLFLGEMNVDEFLHSDDGTTTDFSVKISKDEVEDVEIKDLKAIFKMDETLTKINKTAE